mmetsp:Transcript_8078/g.29371  ORF Transcript_8078/g.29371 Transcript_8078/m.29371 type:complete len:963 (-) Transcript_8078:272-3160(-)
MAGGNLFARYASFIDVFFAKKFHRIGLAVGTRPKTSLALSFLFMIVCCGGISQLNGESRSDKLWIPQGTRAQEDESEYTKYFPPATRLTSMLLESKTGSLLDKASLQAALNLHWEIEAVNTTAENADGKLVDDTLRSLCILQPGRGHPCFVNSVLEAWDYDRAKLSADMNPLDTLNAMGKSKADLARMLGGATFDASGKVTGAKAMTMTYFMMMNRVRNGGGYEDPRGAMWEEKVLEVLRCDTPVCEKDVCACGYESENFKVYGQTTRSFSDVFGAAIGGDVGLINGAFLLMIVYLILNLGGLCHKVNSRALLAFGCTLSIVAAGVSGYGLAMYLGFDYTPAHSILPFVIIGIGVDDSFVIMNAFDRTDPKKPVPERIADTLAHAGVSIMVTSLTDFVAFAISVSSALPALSSFCMYAAFCVLVLLFFQITMFTAFAAMDATRVNANRIDCCFCLPRGCLCCPVVPKEDAAKAVEEGKKDPNQMLCCAQPKHSGGNIGRFLEHVVAPQLVKKPVAATVLFVFTAICAISVWQMTLLSIEDTQRKFIPDDSYLSATINTNDKYFGSSGTRFDIVTVPGDYFSSQKALVDIGPRLGKLDYIVPISADSFSSWAAEFKFACATGNVMGMPVTTDSDGLVTTKAQYYSVLNAWLKGSGGRYAKSVIWASAADPQQGIAASKMAAELKSVNKEVGDRVLPDAVFAVKALDGIRATCDSWSDLPGGKAVPYSYEFLSWETFKIIDVQMYGSTAQCLAAVLVITLATLGHPTAAGLVFICVLMTIIDILGFMQVWGLAIDSVTVIQLVIAVGLSVDYAAHVAHNFMTQVGSKPERMIKTMGDVGSAVLCGGISTFLGVMLLVLSKSYVFRVLFQTFFLTVVLGLAHGLILLPVLLNLVGPPSYHAADEVVVAEVVVAEKAEKTTEIGEEIGAKESDWKVAKHEDALPTLPCSKSGLAAREKQQDKSQGA